MSIISNGEAEAERIKHRIAGRNMALEVCQLIDEHLFDRHFMESFVEKISKQALLIPVDEEPPKPPPIAQLGLTLMPFGQYAGQTFDDCPREYLDWLCRSQEEFYRDLRAYLKHPDLESRRRGIES